MHGKNVRIEAVGAVIPDSVLSFIDHAFDAAMMVANEGCEYRLIITRRVDHDSADKGIRKRVVKAFEEGEDWSVIAKLNGVKYKTE